ncbi:MAG: type II/IV secretion system protein [Dehalococcoidia bacterium]|nr:MAG: type II/IV secretion system protein [Dehalococcoidia bacterium]
MSDIKKVEYEAKTKNRIIKYLEAQGYEVTVNAKREGKSGITHTFDMLAENSDELAPDNIAVCIIAGGDKQHETTAIFNFANKAFDVNIKNRVLIAIPRISPEAKRLAGIQRIKVVDEEKIETFTIQPQEQKTKQTKAFSFKTKEELIDSLTRVGYQIEEQAKIKGRSGVEYQYDILATGNTNRIGHTLGIDIMTGEGEIGLDKVALFDTKAYDTSIDDKVIGLLDVGLTPEAKQFVVHQGIKILQLGENKFANSIIIEEETEGVAPSDKIEEKKEEEKTKDSKSKKLRQQVKAEAVQLIPEVLARRYSAVPVNMNGKTLEVAMSDPTDILALEAFAVQSKMRIKPIAADAKEIRDAIDFNYKGYGEIEKQISNVSFLGEIADDAMALDAAIDAPLAQALNLIIDEAVKARASDIHLEPEETRLRVRYRIDGTLQDMMSLPMDIHAAIISRIKILSNLNIADHHRAQDGQFSTKAKGREIDVRVATAPTVLGEMWVLRLLDKSTATLGMEELGMLPHIQERYEKMLKVPYGMILVSGPTGAGKTTTLYASVMSLDTMGRNIITIEDPAEYRFPDINQIQVNTQAGITFASGLRSILRLDPDVILVGEIRDSETANIAVQAALTGHLMLSSIHANDTVGVLFRLMDLGVEPFLIASSVIGIVAQRMVRKICPDCIQEIEVPLVEQMAYEKETGEKRTKFQYSAGCATCAYTGYLGRTGIFEILSMSDNLRRMIIQGISTADLHDQAIKEGMETMLHDGMAKVKEGITTPAEILRSAYSVEGIEE